MKKSVVKAISLTLCAALVLGGTVSAARAPADSAPAPSSTPAQTQVKAAPSGGEKNVKDETVYVLAQADGTVDKIIVSDWVKNFQGSGVINDVTQLTGIETVKGDAAYTLGGDGSCVWDARGNDVYYQGSIDRELPVSVSVSYTLDGRPITPEELAGKSGRITIRFDYTNRQFEMVEINGKQEKIYVPFAMLTGVVLDSDVFSNVALSNGKLINDGTRIIAAGLAFPGLQDSLGLDKDTLDLPDFVEITADAEGFDLDTTVTIAANGLFRGAEGPSDGHSGLDELEGKLDELTGAMTQLTGGSSQLYDGLCTLLDRSQDLVSGIDQLAAGASQLQSGAGDLSAGAAQLQQGAAQLDQGLAELNANSAQLNAGASQVFNSLLAAAGAQLQTAGLQVPSLTADNYAQVLDGVAAAAGDSPAGPQAAALRAALDSYNAFSQGLQSYTAGVAQASAGAGALNQGAAALKSGADSLSAGAGQLYDGILTMKNSAPALVGGVTQLRDGAMELSSGLREFNEQGVEKLADAFEGDLAVLAARLEAVKAAAEHYSSFAGLSPDMDGQVKFIWRTEAVS